ncbi:ECF sigma factor [Planctomycetes bacterium Poly30]|uniref:ECF sigma factor n=1 Tax=Saltatorellus ferox TaxID=2528018 RepID=A0A518EYS1_9BACT|nr:ECF sigma factor [Planctomycetes bacterium Poly30]
MNPASPRDPLFEAVYDELRALAQSKLRAGLGGASLEATAVVHDVWLKLSEDPSKSELDRSHYFATAAQAMRWILVDRARRRRSRSIASVFGEGTDGDLGQEALDPAQAAADAQLLALDEALVRFEAAYPRKAAVVSHRFFAGLSVEDTARATGLSPATVKREWSFARAWLIRELGDKLPQELR